MSSTTVKPFGLTSYQKVGHIAIPLGSLIAVASNDIDTIANAGGRVSKNSVPIYERINGATDKGQRLRWVAGSVIEVTSESFVYPYDLNDASAVTVKLLAKMSGAVDTPVIGVSYFEGIGDTNAGGNTAALSSTLQTLSVTIAAGDVGAYPNFATIGLTPAAHATDAIWLYGVWIEYVRR